MIPSYCTRTISSIITAITLSAVFGTAVLGIAVLFGVVALLVTTMFEPTLVGLVAIDPAELARFVPVVSTALYSAADVDLASLIGRIVVAVSALIGAANIDLAHLNRGVRVFGLSRYRAAQGCQYCGNGEREHPGSYVCHSDYPHFAGVLCVAAPLGTSPNRCVKRRLPTPICPVCDQSTLICRIDTA